MSDETFLGAASYDVNSGESGMGQEKPPETGPTTEALHLPPLPPKIELIGKLASINFESATDNYRSEGKILGFTGENIFLAIEEEIKGKTYVTLIPTGRIISIRV